MATLICGRCRGPIQRDYNHAECPHCGALLRETLEDDMALPRAEDEMRAKKRSRKFLSSVAFLQIGTVAFVALQFGTSSPLIRDPLKLWSGLGFGFVVVALWVWSGKRPFEAALTALSLDAALLLENVLVAPGAFLRNERDFMVKGFGLFALVAAVFYASEHRRLKRDRERRAARDG